MRPDVVTNDLTLQTLGEKGYFDPEYYTSGELQTLVNQLQSLRTSHDGEELVVVSTGARVELFLASDVTSIVATGTDAADTYRLEGLNGRVDGITIDARGGVDLIEVQGDAAAVNAFFGTLLLSGGSGDDYLRVDPSVLGAAATTSSYVLSGGDGGDRVKLLKDKDDDAAAATAVSYSYSGVNLDGGAGDDVLFGHTGSENIVGGAGNDVIYAFAGTDTIDAGDQDDYITAGPGNDTISAGAGNDRVLGGPGLDVIHGGDGADRLLGQEGDDTLHGDAGDDVLVGGLGNDTLFGGDGNDALNWQLGDGADTVSGDAGDDQLSMIAYMIDEDAFYSDPDNYVVDDAGVDTLRLTATTSDDAAGFKTASLTWQHGTDPLLTTSIGAIETLKLDAGRGADDIQIGDLQNTAVDSVRVSGGETRGLVDDVLISRDAQGQPIAQDVTIVGAVGELFRLKFGPYGIASGIIEIAADDLGALDPQTTALAIQAELRKLMDSATLDVTYVQDSATLDAGSGDYTSTYKVSGIEPASDALQLDDVNLTASASSFQEFTLSGSVGQAFQLKLGPSGTPTSSITFADDGAGAVHAMQTAMDIQAALSATLNIPSLQVAYDSARSVYQVAGLSASDALLELETTNLPAGIALTAAFTQELILDGVAGQSFQLQFGSAGTPTATISLSGGASGVDTGVTATAIQTALRGLSGFASVAVNYDSSAAAYRVNGFTQAAATLQSVPVAASPVTANFTTSQRLSLSGTVGKRFRLRFGADGLSSDVLVLAPTDEGALDTESTATDIQVGLRELTGNSAITVSYDSNGGQYVIKGLAASAADLQIDVSGLQSDVAGSAIVTRNVGLTGTAGQQFRLQLGPAGKSTRLLSLASNGSGGVDTSATAAALQTELRSLVENASIAVTYDSAAAVYQIAGLSAPSGAIRLDTTGITTDVTVVAAAGGDVFKVFQIGPENAVDRIVIEGSAGSDDYRVSTLESIGLDGAGQTSLRFEQLNGQQTTAGTLLSHVIVDVFGLDTTDYVRLDTLADDDQIDATSVIDPVVSNLYLYGGSGDDRIIGSQAANIADVIVGGTGSDRLTGGPGVDRFYEQDEQNDANESGESDTLIETRDANFWLSDTSLRIDDTGLHDQFGDEPETFADVFEAVELYGLDGANRFEISNWSDSGLLDGYKGGDTYILELSTSVAGQQFFNINDTGASGIDSLQFLGSSGPDTIQLDTVYVPAEDPDGKFTDARWTEYGDHGQGLLIGHFNSTSTGYDQKNLDDEDQLMQVSASALSAGDNYQVVNYFTVEQVTLFGGEGDDKFISDSTSAKIDVFGNAGDDQFYIGSVLETEDVLVEGQIVTIVKQITDGAAFNGTAYYGGDDDDYFEVNHNVADINLYGDNGDDTFLVKALLTIDEDGELLDLESKTATVSGTFGENSSTGSDTSTDTREVDIDTLVYVENANIAIDGGAGFDAVSLVGTVLSDTFYVYVELDPDTNRPVQRIFGAGVKLQKLLNIERLQLLAGGGDDTIYLYGTDMGTIGDMVIKGGSGSDTIYVGGDAEIITQSFPKNSDQFYSTVEGFDVPKDATGKFIRAGEVDGMPFYTVRDLARIVPFVVENPARTVTRTMPAISDLTPFRSPVLVEGGEGLNDRVIVNFAAGTPDLQLRDVELYKKDVTFDDTKIALASLAVDPLTDLPAILLASTGAAGQEAQQLLGDAATNYLRFRDRYYEPTLLSGLQALTGTATQQVTIPQGVGYFNIQTKLESGQVVTCARN